jgi:hypothetical protein
MSSACRRDRTPGPAGKTKLAEIVGVLYSGLGWVDDREATSPLLVKTLEGCLELDGRLLLPSQSGGIIAAA